MKIRQGFVSNSSSSSFVALGFSFDDKDSGIYRKMAISLGAEEEFNKEMEEYAASEYYKEENIPEAERETFCWEIDKKGIRVLTGSQDGVGEDDSVVALMLAETDGSYFDSGEIVCDESDSDYLRIKELKDKVSPEAKIRIIYGTRSC
jgi:hypothetical protein